MKVPIKIVLGLIGFVVLLAFLSSVSELSFANSNEPTIESLSKRLQVLEVEQAELIKAYTGLSKNVTQFVLAEAIIQCESSGRSHVTNLKASVGKDVGYFQVNTYFHEDKAKLMGLDLNNYDDNLEYGVWLLAKYGTAPWKASEHCWRQALSTLESVTAKLHAENRKG